VKMVCMHVCKDSAAPAHALHTRTQARGAPRQSSGVSQTPHPTACPQAGIPSVEPYSCVCMSYIYIYIYIEYEFPTPGTTHELRT